MWKQNCVNFLMQRRLFVIAVLVCITAGALFFSLKVRFDSSIEIWFLENDPNLEAYHDFLDRFEGDEIIVIGVFADDVFENNRRLRVYRLVPERNTDTSQH